LPLYHIHLASQLLENELLLKHLDLFVESLEITELQLIDVLEENPTLRERSSV
jgi:hypothetical protein